MANIFIAKYTIEGNKNDIENLYNIMEEVQKENKSPNCRWGFYYGDLLNKLGYNEDYCMCRGGWEKIRKRGNIIKFDSYSAYQPCFELFELIKQIFPSIKYYYKGDDEFGQFPTTNDVDKKHYKYSDKYEVQNIKDITQRIIGEIYSNKFIITFIESKDKEQTAKKIDKFYKEELTLRYPHLPILELLKDK